MHRVSVVQWPSEERALRASSEGLGGKIKKLIVGILKKNQLQTSLSKDSVLRWPLEERALRASSIRASEEKPINQSWVFFKRTSLVTGTSLGDSVVQWPLEERALRASVQLHLSSEGFRGKVTKWIVGLQKNQLQTSLGRDSVVQWPLEERALRASSEGLGRGKNPRN